MLFERCWVLWSVKWCLWWALASSSLSLFKCSQQWSFGNVQTDGQNNEDAAMTMGYITYHQCLFFTLCMILKYIHLM